MIIIGEKINGSIPAVADAIARRDGEFIKENPDTKIICCSALLTTTMPALKDAVALINEASFRPNVKVMVGGAPITQAFADEIGADAYTEDAASCAKKARELAA